ncbi:bifunctional folylpolyglutamate synthase/dihydrofolate synthase [Sphingomonas sp. BN140010]|uniref:Dihydrofolate synthase/folylpolyglutamate synthase n=1 Tax=Sphingomonas arvum TaxID=2992113 RepID=A0ABT3JHI6_9SPHN|nr:folylpolyglutamate synthase/dihydrofolate synthase family protein [Sphingomonas sp. BN140010]MCW3798542.1 bifunctional folylpolyglutamate synthase/dihydrofolate synthase [Sphingomonas sp. BN140010]
MADGARSDHPGVQAQLDRLAALSPGGDRLGLERITSLLDRLGRPQDRLPPVLHVAGTNGKGSTCAFLRTALEAAGHRVHAFTSPHLVRFNERIRLAGTLIDDDRLAALLGEVLDASAAIEPSFFEVTAAAAFLAFARTPADALVLEVGMGGRLDATNVIARPLVTGIAALGHDHQQWLGAELTGIAAEKAAIAKPGVPLVTLAYPPEVAARVAEVTAAVGATLIAQGNGWDVWSHVDHLHYRDGAGDLRLPRPALPGAHQVDNAGLAIGMLRHQSDLALPETALAAAMRDTRWPARLQQLRPGPLIGDRQVWLDGGHNPQAAEALAEAMSGLVSGPLHLVTGVLTTKDARGLLAPFRGVATQVHAVGFTHELASKPHDLAATAQDLGLPATAHATVADALTAIPAEAPALIAGSLYLAGEVLALNDESPS